MGQGYIRNDTPNNIADGNVIDAADLDGEFDSLVASFEAATGHTHDGTAAEGGAITVVGPAQDYVGAAGDFSPKTDSTYDLGKTAVRWATNYLDDLDVTTNIVVGGTVDGRDVATDGTKLDGIEALADVTDVTNVTAAGALMDSELTSIASVKALNQGVATTDTPTFASVTIPAFGTVDGRDVSVDGTKLDTIETGADVTDVTNVTAAGALMDSEVDADIKTLVLPANTTISTYGATLVDDADAATARTTLGVAIGTNVQAYDANLPTWPATVDATEVGYLNGVTSAIQTQIDAKVAAASPTFTGVPAAPTASDGTDSTQIATTAFVASNRVADAIFSGPSQSTAGTVGLDTTIRNVGGFATLSSNRVTLAAGTYLIVGYSSIRLNSAITANSASIALRDVTGAANLVAQGVRSSEFAQHTALRVERIVTIGSSNVYELNFDRDNSNFQVGTGSLGAGHSGADQEASYFEIWRL